MYNPITKKQAVKITKINVPMHKYALIFHFTIILPTMGKLEAAISSLDWWIKSHLSLTALPLIIVFPRFRNLIWTRVWILFFAGTFFWYLLHEAWLSMTSKISFGKFGIEILSEINEYVAIATMLSRPSRVWFLAEAFHG